MMAFLTSLVLVVLISLGAWFGLEQVDETSAQAYSTSSVRLGDVAEASGTPEVDSGPGVGAALTPGLDEAALRHRAADNQDEAAVQQRTAGKQAIQPDAVRVTPIEDTVETGPEAGG